MRSDFGAQILSWTKWKKKQLHYRIYNLNDISNFASIDIIVLFKSYLFFNSFLVSLLKLFCELTLCSTLKFNSSIVDADPQFSKPNSGWLELAWWMRLDDELFIVCIEVSYFPLQLPDTSSSVKRYIGRIYMAVGLFSPRNFIT